MTNIEKNHLAHGFTQVIIWQQGTEGLEERALVMRNYDEGYVSISDGDHLVTIAKGAANDVAKWLRKLSTLKVEDKSSTRTRS